ncbi:MAG: NADH-quinone oxidoreductase subunit NuoN [Gammaproteobacteria bacterium]|nr:NADH-quinone oxidoreductase subunit NuoN [Gammaproteobacteria bacterium]
MNFVPASAEILILIMACVTLLLSVYLKRPVLTHVPYFIAQLALIGAAVITINQFGKPTLIALNGFFIQDNFSVLLKVIIYVCGFLTFLYSRQYLREKHMPYNEFYVLGLFSILGMMILVSSYNFLSLFLGLELTSLPIYAMIAFKRDSGICSEASIKFFIIGTMATGLLLYGLSMLYGATGSIQMDEVAKVIAATLTEGRLILILGLVFVVVGIAFKLGAVPFHMWVPDVYEGAPSAVTLFLASAAKVAALGLAIRLLVFAMPGLLIQWQQQFIVISILSIAMGNIIAIVQTNLKRMLAYSSIAHIGYMSLGLVAGTPQGYAAATFYMISYAIMTVGAFGLIVILSRSGFEMESIDDFKGLNAKNPWLAFMMLIIMFSLAGIPPIVGFMAKVGVLEALIEVHMVWLAAVAIVFAIVGSYYYLRVVKVMYFDEPDLPGVIVCPLDMRIAMTVNSLTVLLLGIFPGILFNLCHAAFFNLS